MKRRLPTLGALALACAVAACDPLGTQYATLCKAGETKIVREIPRVESYVDLTGNGCSTQCFYDLKDEVVQFVELSFSLNRFLERKRTTPTFDAGLPRPPADGLWAAAIPHDGTCDAMFSRTKVRPFNAELWKTCLQFRSIDAFVSAYTFQQTHTYEAHNGELLVGGLREIRERKTGALVASGGMYIFDSLHLFGYLPSHVSCGDLPALGFARAIDKS